VWAWGTNATGQLGDGGPDVGSVTPVQVPGLSGIVSVSAGDSHSLALHGDGTVWAWGSNWYSQLGDGTTLQRRTPVQVPGASGMVAISAGKEFSLTVRDGGTPSSWGANHHGQLGEPYYRVTPEPCPLP
jgi:alpha-tubulin suppressor-like RCC1 family protein